MAACPVNRACTAVGVEHDGTQAAYFIGVAGSNRDLIACGVYVIHIQAGWQPLSQDCGYPMIFPAVGQSGPVGLGFENRHPGDCANVRTLPGPTGKVVACLPDGTQVRLDSGPAYVPLATTNGLWWHIAGRGWMVDDFLGRYLEVSGDRQLPLLLDFYCCYRAYVRGKVDSLGLTEREMGTPQRRRLAQRARRFFRLAARYAGAAHARQLIVMMGVSASGKSHLGRLLAIELRAALLSSDVTRKGFMGVATTSDAGSAAYTTEQTDRTYAALLNQAEQELRRGHAVLLDATFLLARRRLPALELARRLGVPFSLFWCQATAAQIEDRLRLRQDDPYRVSDAGGSIVEAQLDRVEPPRELPRGSVIRVDTSKPIPGLLGRIRRRLA